MQIVDIAFGDGAGAEYLDADLKPGVLKKMVGLDDGTVRGLPSLAFFIAMEDGSVVVAETTWRMLNAMHAACLGRFGPVE